MKEKFIEIDLEKEKQYLYKDYTVFENENGKYVSSLRSGNVPCSFFKSGPELKTEYEIDLRNIDQEYFNPWKYYTDEEEEMFKKPTKFEHFKKRIDIISKKAKKKPNNSKEFYSWMKYKCLNVVPTKNKEGIDLLNKIDNYLLGKFTYRKYLKIIKKCASFIITKLYDNKLW